MIKELFANQVEEVEGITSNDMTQEWNDQEVNFVDSTIRGLFIRKTLTDHRGNKKRMINMETIEDFFGLPYTSSSSFAMYGVTNTRFCLDTEEEYGIDCFGLGNDGNIYIWCTDREENEKVYKVI